MAHEDDVFVHIGGGENASKLFDNLVQLLQLLAKGMRLLDDGCAEDFGRRTLLARSSVLLGSTRGRAHAMQGPLARNLLVGMLAVGARTLRHGR